MGFAKSSFVTIGRRRFDYTDKTVNEFLNVSTGIGTASIGDKVDSDGIAIGYRDGDVRRSVKLRILNSIVDFEGSGILQQKGSEYNIKTLGIKKTDRRYSEWLENIATKHVVQDCIPL